MPRHSQHCTSCEWNDDVVVQPFEHPPCPTCGAATERWWPIGGSATHGISSDEFIGGKWIENLDTKPIWVESRSHLKREMKARGLEERIRHVGQDHGDKSPFTTRWY
jgi:hypothetical protein